MRIMIHQEKLAKGLEIVKRAVASRSSLAVLSNVWIGAEEGRIRLAATDLEISITAWVEAEIESPGALTVSASLFADLVSCSPTANLTLATNGKPDLAYQCGAIKTEIQGISADEFPAIPDADGDILIRAGLLREMIAQVAFNTAVDRSRPILTGIFFKLSDGVLTLVSADGYRLSVRAAPVGETETRIAAIVPARAFTELARILKDDDETVRVGLTPTGNQITFRTGDRQLVSQLINGNFPDYQVIIPRSHQTRVVFDTTALLGAMRRANLIARDASNFVRLGIVPGAIRIGAEAADVGAHVEEIAAQAEGPDLEIALNCGYLIQALEACGAAQTAMELTSASSPGVVRAVGAEEAWIHVIMPMHIGKTKG